MISIIVCSIDKNKLDVFKKNIEKTIGCPYEIIDFDNIKQNWSITKVYNHCAALAKYDLLCFSHEDVLFDTEKWGSLLIDQLHQPECGVIGFAGSRIKTKNYSGWGAGGNNNRFNYIEISNDGKEELHKYNVNNEDFSEVIVLDGFCLFVNRHVYNSIKFDESTFNGFHLYDLDFTFATSLQFKNYVCNIISIKHYSSGSYNASWFYASKLFHHKWDEKLPKSIDSLSAFRIQKIELKAIKDFLKLSWNTPDIYPKKEKLSVIMAFLKKHPYNLKAVKLLIFILLKSRSK